MLAGTVDLLDDPDKTTETDDFRELVRNIQKLSVILETEMNKAVLSCTRARRQLLAQMPATKPALQ